MAEGIVFTRYGALESQKRGRELSREVAEQGSQKRSERLCSGGGYCADWDEEAKRKKIDHLRSEVLLAGW